MKIRRSNKKIAMRHHRPVWAQWKENMKLGKVCNAKADCEITRVKCAQFSFAICTSSFICRRHRRWWPDCWINDFYVNWFWKCNTWTNHKDQLSYSQPKSPHSTRNTPLHLKFLRLSQVRLPRDHWIYLSPKTLFSYIHPLCCSGTYNFVRASVSAWNNAF